MRSSPVRMLVLNVYGVNVVNQVLVHAEWWVERFIMLT